MADRPRESARLLAGDAGAKIENHNDHSLAGPWLIDTPEAARLLNISERKLWSLSRCGAIPSRRIGRRLLFDPIELRGWLDAGCSTSPGAGGRVRRAMRREARR